MATGEQLEVWAKDASESLAKKVGDGASVIVMILDSKGDRLQIERRGDARGIIYLLEAGSKMTKDAILPKSTITRKD